MRIGLVLVLILLGTLALFNPSPEDFRAFAQQRVQDTISDHARAAGGGLFGDIGAAVGGTLAGALANRTAQRDNYFVASVYTIDLDGANRDAEEWKFLGIAGQFIPLKKPESLGG
jgi:hypothetical protein